MSNDASGLLKPPPADRGICHSWRSPRLKLQVRCRLKLNKFGRECELAIRQAQASLRPATNPDSQRTQEPQILNPKRLAFVHPEPQTGIISIVAQNPEANTRKPRAMRCEQRSFQTSSHLLPPDNFSVEGAGLQVQNGQRSCPVPK